MKASVLELIKQIQKRPAMYLSRNYISALRAYMDGWLYRDYQNADVEIMNEFQDWISQKYKMSSHSWDRIIALYSADECDALKNFFIEFSKFYKEKHDIDLGW
jgi:hypothetical protein